jgi:uncharacterized protein YndB with AHSA1/START domain
MTSNPRILGTLGSADGKGVVRMTDVLDAKVAAVWAALTEQARLTSWMGEFTGELRLGGEFQARFHASGWDGAGRVAACEPGQRLLVLTRMTGKTDEQVIEVTLTDEGDRTEVVWEERGMPLAYVADYGAGIQVHVEDLAAYLAGHGRCDAQARFDELRPAYQALAG